jgi:hypothetical protein
VFFGAIGLGFILIEMAQMQRLMVFLGRPTYALSVVLFTLLSASGVGSFIAHQLSERRGPRALQVVFAALLGLLLLVGLASPPLMRHFESASIAGRVVLAVALLLTIGVVMGMPFTLGMRRADRVAATLSPWLWGINGATSVCASVLAVVIAISLGIGASYWFGLACYVVAGGIYALAVRSSPPTEVDETERARAGA